MGTTRRALRDAFLLTLLCAAAYAFGPVDHGLTNWQESIRVVVAQEMQHAHDWVVPTIQGKVYLAKPPMIYWAQLTIASLTGRDVSLLDLRLTVALAGWLGVLATWFTARRLLTTPPSARTPTTPWIVRRLMPRVAAARPPGVVPPDSDTPTASPGAPWGERAAFWGAAALATGILYTRSARIGELDVLLVPSTALAILGAFECARVGRWSSPKAWAWLGLHIAAMACAGLTKGPPGMLTGQLAILGWTLCRAAAPGFADQARRPIIVGAGVIAALAAGGAIAATRTPASINDAIGLGFFSLAAGAAAALLVACCTLEGLVRLARDTVRTAWPLGAATGMGALWLWSKAVEARVGRDAIERYAAGEAADNINALVLDAPARGLEVFAYAAGLGSIAAIIAIVWILRDRPRLPATLLLVAAWIVFPLVVFSAFGRGTHRYLIPTVPAIALLGGVWIASWIRDKRPTLGPRLMGAIVALLALGQGAWYGHLRDERYAHRSPREFIAELVRTPGVDPTRLGCLDVWTPAFDYYAAHPVRPFFQIDTSVDFPHAVEPIDTLREELARTGGWYTLIVRTKPAPRFASEASPIDRLRAVGFVVEPIDMQSDFRVDRFSTPMTAVRVRASD